MSHAWEPSSAATCSPTYRSCSSACDTFYMYRVLTAEGEGALYVAFMGTKQRRDLLTNANAMQTPLWLTAEVDGNQVSSPFLCLTSK